MTHAPTAASAPGRYPHYATCPCGWRSMGYLAEFVAQMAADDHEKEMARAESA